MKRMRKAAPPKSGVRAPRLQPAYRAEQMSSIVIIEEDDLMHGWLKEWLTAEGSAVRGQRLHELSGTEGADLVIVDLYRPRETGAEGVLAVQQAYPGVPVIAISAQFRPGLESSWWAARALGVQHLMAKPFTREDLLAAVRAIVGQPG